MVHEFYAAFDDPYCYPGSSVLRNRRDLRDQEALERWELEAVGLRMAEAPPRGRYDAKHYRVVHRRLFGDVYAWAGRYRTVRMSKGSTDFGPPDHIGVEMDRKFAGLTRPPFQRGSAAEDFIPALAEFLGELNAIHPFREGNGRTQLRFARMLGQRAGHQLRLEAIEPEPFLTAMIASYRGDLARLTDELERMLA